MFQSQFSEAPAMTGASFKLNNQPTEAVDASEQMQLERAASAAHSRRVRREGGEDEIEEDFEEIEPMFNTQVQDLEKGIERKKLNVDAKAFIPTYHPSMSFAEFEKSLQGVFPGADVLRQKQYPLFWISKIHTVFTRGSVSNPFPKMKREASEVYESEQRAMRVSGVFHNSFDKGEVAGKWRIRASGGHRVPKPSKYTTSSFRAWVDGEATHYAKRFTKPTDYVSGNLSAQALYYGTSAATPRMTERMLQNSAIYPASYQQSKDVRFSRTSYAEHLCAPAQTLRVSGRDFSTSREWEEAADVLRKHKPLFRAGQRFFAGEPEDRAALQRLLLEKFPEDAFAQSGSFLRESRVKAKQADQHEVVEKQGWLNFKHNVEVQHSFIMPGLKEGIAQMFGTESETAVRTSVQFVAAIIGVWTSTSWTNAVAVLTQLVASNSRLFEMVSSRLLSLAPPTVHQGPGEWFQTVAVEYIRPLWDSLVESLATFMTETFCPSIKDMVTPILYSIVSGFKKAVSRQTGEALAKSTLAALKEIFDRIVASIKTSSFAPLWGRDWDPERFHVEVETIILHKNILMATSSSVSANKLISELRTEGKLSSMWFEPVARGVFVDRVEELILRGRAMLKYFAENSSLVSVIRRDTNLMVEMVAALNVQSTALRARCAAFGIMFWGEPGVGKSVVSTIVADAVGHVAGLPLDTGSYVWQTSANFQDGLSSDTWRIYMDDVDQSLAPITAGKPTHIESVIQICNNVPMPVEQARVEDKGTVYASPVLLSITSNFQDMRMNTFTRQPAAFLRRINVHVEVLVKPEYAMENGRVDVDKARGERDIYLFKVRYPSSHRLNGSVFKVAPEEMGLYGLIKVVQERFLMHREAQLEVVRGLSLKKDHCDSCGLALNPHCACAPPEEEDCDDVVAEVGLQGQSLTSIIVFGLSPSKVVQFTHACSLVYYVGLGVGLFFSLAEINKLYYDSGRTGFKKHVMRNKHVTADDVKDFEDLGGNSAHVRDYYGYPNQDFYHRMRSAIFGSYEGTIHRGLSVYAPALGAAAAFVGAYILVQMASDYAIDYVFQGREGNASAGLLPATWTRAEQKYSPGLPPSAAVTYTYDDMMKSIADSYCKVVAGCGMTMSAYAAGGSTIVFPTHLLGESKEVTITHKQKVIKVLATRFNTIELPSNRELSLMHCPELFGGPGIITRLPRVRDESIVMYDEVLLVNPTVKYTPEHNSVGRVNTMMCIKTTAPTVNGDCGTLYVARHGTKWAIIGMHYGLVAAVNPYSIGGLMLRQEIEACAKNINSPCAPVAINQGMLTGSSVRPTFSEMQPRSEIWAAMTHPGAVVLPIGYMDPPLASGKNLSKLKISSFADIVEPYTTGACGIPHYWKIPDFRGSMVDGKWVSPYTDAFSTQNQVIPDSFYMSLAIIDYLSGMGDLDREGYSELSEEQMLKGIPGSYLNKVNQKTSVGPPFKGPKTRYMWIGDEEVVMSPEIWELYDEIEATLERGEIPSAFGTVTLKDEPVKPNKLPRVFIVLACAYNFSMRKHGAWQLFMRANPMFFESAVGINMTSSEANKVVHHLKEVDPTLTHLYANDAKRMDKSLSGGLLDAVTVVVGAMSGALGVSRKSAQLVQGLKHMTYNCKNDLFSILGWNPSGNQWTVEINGIVTSLGMRFAHYKTNGFYGDTEEVLKIWRELEEKPLFVTPSGLTFRDEKRLITYGDDNLVASPKPLTQEFLDIWKDDLGVIMTDAIKSEGERTMEPSNITQIDFLKRSFVWDDELQYYLTPLHEKTIARMLMIKKDSSMTDPDHAAAILTDVMREAAYHGAEKHAELQAYADEIIERMQIQNNPYLIMSTYEKKREQMRSGEFQTWSNKDAPPAMEEFAFVNFQSTNTNMSQFNLVNAPNDGAINSTASTAVSSETTQFVSASAEERAESSDNPKFFQKMPQHMLGNFLERAVQLDTITLSNINPSETIVFEFDPWEKLIDNVAFRDKIKNFALLRGTIQVIGNVAASGICYGHYVVTALPNADAFDGVSQDLIVENCRQTDFFVDVDVASSNNFVLQLPWVWPYDYASVAQVRTMWTIYVTCLAPVKSGIAGGSPTCNVTFFASLLPDHELVLPIYQGKRELVANHALKTMAPKLHDTIGEGKLSGMARQVGDIATSLSKVPMIGSFAAPVASVAAGVESIASLFGFTRENDERAPLPFTMRSVTNVARFDGPDAGDSASLSMANTISTDPTLADGVAEDQLSLASVADRWTLVYSQPWAIGATGIIGSVPVSPFFGRDGGDRQIHLTSAGYYGLPFTYWRGDMEYQIIIPRTAVHRGNLQILWEPVDLLTPVNPTNVTINTVIDVSEAGMVQFTVGYAREEPYQLVRPFTREFGIQPSGTTNGRLLFRVINPLTSQSETADTTIFVFARMKSCSFALPSTNVRYLNEEGSGTQRYPLTNSVILQGGSAIGDGIKPEATSIQLVPESGPYPGKELFFGEEVPSARALMQKPSLAYRTSGTTVRNVVPSPPDDALWTWCGWYGAMYVGVASSMRYKMFPRETCWLGVSPVVRDGDADLLSTLAPMTFAGPGLGAEFVVPYYLPKKFQSARDKNPAAQRGNQIHVFESGEDAIVYESCGPDLRVSRFRQIPTVKFVGRPVPPMWFV